MSVSGRSLCGRSSFRLRERRCAGRIRPRRWGRRASVEGRAVSGLSIPSSHDHYEKVQDRVARRGRGSCGSTEGGRDRGSGARKPGRLCVLGRRRPAGDRQHRQRQRAAGGADLRRVSRQKVLRRTAPRLRVGQCPALHTVWRSWRSQVTPQHLDLVDTAAAHVRLVLQQRRAS